MNAYRKELDYDEDEIIEMLDEIYGDVEICGMTYSSGQALLELDPIAFRQAKLEIEDSNERDNPVWVCSVCDSEFENEDDAEECCKPDDEEDDA